MASLRCRSVLHTRQVVPGCREPLGQLLEQTDMSAPPHLLFHEVQAALLRPRLVWARSRRSASASSSLAVRSRAAQIEGLPARSASSRYQQASSRSLVWIDLHGVGVHGGSPLRRSYQTSGGRKLMYINVNDPFSARLSCLDLLHLIHFTEII